MKLFESWAGTLHFRQLLDHLSDPVLVFDRHAVIRFANSAALRLLSCEVGLPLLTLRPLIGAASTDWLQLAITGRAQAKAATTKGLPPANLPPANLPDGRLAALAWQPLDASHSALWLSPEPKARGARSAPDDLPRRATGVVSGVANELLKVFWGSPYPASLQDADFRLVDVNRAYLAFTGYEREQLVGADPIDWQPAEDRDGTLAERAQLRQGLEPAADAALRERRLTGADGRQRWFRAARHVLLDGTEQTFYLAVLQDVTAEHVARERADRSAHELGEWFDLSPVGMVLYDDGGLMVRTNPAFDALAGRVPALISEAPESLRGLLAWSTGAQRGPLPELQPGGEPVQREGWLQHPDGSWRRLRANVRCYATPSGQRRFMAAVEDRSLEEERDLAQMQIGALMDTAGVGLATFQESPGGGRQATPSAPVAAALADNRPAAANATSAALQSISRDIVVPEFLPEFEKIQHALRHAQRVEARYAIRHPELGQRWLLTRVEPATLASGKRTTSVVTLDITEQQQSQARSEQLLREMTTILESSTAGMAYLRGEVLVRCNQRFAALLGLRGEGLAGQGVRTLFGRHTQAEQIASETLRALQQDMVHETEFEVASPASSRHASRWYSLSVRRTGPRGQTLEAIAVLSDITRLKNQQIELEILVRDRELMFNLSEVGIAFVRDGTILQANEALAQLAGLPVEALNQRSLSSLFPAPEDVDLQRASEEKALRARGRWVGEQPLRRHDGALLWVQVSQRLVVEGDLSAGMIVSYVNVDDRRRAERAVALQAERTRAILDSVLVGIVTVGPGGIEWMNRSARRMFAGDLADFVNAPLSAVATAEPDHPFRQTHYLHDLVEGEAETFECRVKARDGREFWVVGNAVATERDAVGRQLTYALLDIERRRQAEARSGEAQASLQRIIEAAPLAITLHDSRSLRVLQINEVAARILGLPASEIVGRAPEELHDPAVATVMRGDMTEALSSVDVTRREYTLEQAGESRTWDARYLPLAAEGGPPDQLLLVATDVTEQRLAQQAKFDAAIAQRDMLVKEVHHRIKNNLQGVAGLLQQIAQRKPEVSAVIAEVVGQVQAIAQVYGLQVGVAGPLRLQGVMEAISGSVQRTFGHAISLSVEGVDAARWALPEAESIPIALTINELLTNAIKHSTGSEPVTCQLIAAVDGVRIVISNTARLAEGFSLAQFPGGVSGLGLVRSLLPRRGASLTLEQQGAHVVATVAVVPPRVLRVDTGHGI